MLPRKDHNHEVHPSRDAERRTDEEQTMTKHNRMVTLTDIQTKKNCNRGTALK